MVKDEKVSAEEEVRDIRRQTRRKYNAEENIQFVLKSDKSGNYVAKYITVMPRAKSSKRAF